MQSRRWSCGVRLVAWTWVWSVAALGAWCIPANEGKNPHGDTLGSMAPLLGTRLRSDKCGRSVGLLQADYTVPTSELVFKNEFELMIFVTLVSAKSVTTDG